MGATVATVTYTPRGLERKLPTAGGSRSSTPSGARRTQSPSRGTNSLPSPTKPQPPPPSRSRGSGSSDGSVSPTHSRKASSSDMPQFAFGMSLSIPGAGAYVDPATLARQQLNQTVPDSPVTGPAEFLRPSTSRSRLITLESSRNGSHPTDPIQSLEHTLTSLSEVDADAERGKNRRHARPSLRAAAGLWACKCRLVFDGLAQVEATVDSHSSSQRIAIKAVWTELIRLKERKSAFDLTSRCWPSLVLLSDGAFTEATRPLIESVFSAILEDNEFPLTNVLTTLRSHLREHRAQLDNNDQSEPHHEGDISENNESSPLESSKVSIRPTAPELLLAFLCGVPSRGCDHTFLSPLHIASGLGHSRSLRSLLLCIEELVEEHVGDTKDKETESLPAEVVFDREASLSPDNASTYWTPLALAAASGSLECVSQLISSHRAIAASNASVPPLKLCIRQQDSQLSSTSNFIPPLIAAVTSASLAVVQVLLDYMSSITSSTEKAATLTIALVSAVRMNLEPLVEPLLVAGADPLLECSHPLTMVVTSPECLFHEATLVTSSTECQDSAERFMSALNWCIRSRSWESLERMLSVAATSTIRVGTKESGASLASADFFKQPDRIVALVTNELSEPKAPHIVSREYASLFKEQEIELSEFEELASLGLQRSRSSALEAISRGFATKIRRQDLAISRAQRRSGQDGPQAPHRADSSGAGVNADNRNSQDIHLDIPKLELSESTVDDVEATTRGPIPHPDMHTSPRVSSPVPEESDRSVNLSTSLRPRAISPRRPSVPILSLGTALITVPGLSAPSAHIEDAQHVGNILSLVAQGIPPPPSVRIYYENATPSTRVVGGQPITPRLIFRDTALPGLGDVHVPLQGSITAASSRPSNSILNPVVPLGSTSSGLTTQRATLSLAGASVLSPREYGTTPKPQTTPRSALSFAMSLASKHDQSRDERLQRLNESLSKTRRLLAELNDGSSAGDPSK